MRTKEMIYSSILIAIGIVLPMIFHALGGAGKVFLPMHLSVIIAGYLLSPAFAILVGILTPIFSSLLTGMPVIYPILPIMVLELLTYSGIISLILRRKKKSVFITLILAMVSGRLMAGFMVYLLTITMGLKISPMMYLKGAIVTGLPGILIQLILIPSIIYALEKTKVLYILEG